MSLCWEYKLLIKERQRQSMIEHADNKNDWQRTKKFHEEISKKIYDTIVPYILKED